MTDLLASLVRPPNPEAVVFLEGLYGAFDDGWLTLFSLHRPTGQKNTDFRHVTDIVGLATAAAGRADRCVWYGVATRRQQLLGGARGGAADCVAIPGLWLDVDVAGPNHTATDLPATLDAGLDLITSFPAEPTVIIATGGGLQAHWAFAEPLEIDQAARDLLSRWGATWTAAAEERNVHLDNVFDGARIMRLPGTRNTKGGRNDPVEILAADWGIRYGTDDLDQWLTDPPPAPPSRPVDRIPYIGPERPGDAYNARHSVDEVLRELGFEPHNRRHASGDLHYKAPGASGDTGATSYSDGHATIWSETYGQANPALELRKPYDPFRLLVATKFAGDHSRAASDLRASGYGSTDAGGICLEDLIAVTSASPSAAGDADSRAERSTDAPWDEPLALEGPPPPEFPLDALPGWVGDHCAVVADRLQVPVDLCGQLALGVLAAIAMGRVKVAVRASWVEHVNLYLTTVMSSGSGKSPADRAIVGALRR
nr:DUF3987 domain-containing protein [Acidimicrobiia bacterium]